MSERFFGAASAENFQRLAAARTIPKVILNKQSAR
jgi:hypothetical protein